AKETHQVVGGSRPGQQASLLRCVERELVCISDQQKERLANRPNTLQAYGLKTLQHHDHIVEASMPYASTQIHMRQTFKTVQGLAARRHMFPDWFCTGKQRCGWRQVLPGIRHTVTASHPQQHRAKTKGVADQAYHVTLPPSENGRYAVSAPQ